jgi:hypothetical protein
MISFSLTSQLNESRFHLAGKIIDELGHRHIEKNICTVYRIIFVKTTDMSVYIFQLNNDDDLDNKIFNERIVQILGLTFLLTKNSSMIRITEVLITFLNDNMTLFII